jgi:hypothetical protein
MANRFARCLNTDYCSLGDQRLVMRLADTEPFFCPECAHALTPAPPWRNGARISPILGVAAMSVLAVASGLLVAKHWPHAVSSPSPVWAAPAATAQEVPAPSVMGVFAGAADADMMPDPGRLFLAATMDDWLPARAGDYILRKRRMRAPRTDPLAVAARAALEDGVPGLPPPPAPPASMPWRQAMIMAALVSSDQPLSAPPPPSVVLAPANPPVAAQAAVSPIPQTIPRAPGAAGGRPVIRPQTSLVPTTLPANRLAEVKPSPAALPNSTPGAPPAPLTPFVQIVQQAALQRPVLQHALHENLAQSAPPVRPAAPAPRQQPSATVPARAPVVAKAAQPAAAEQRTQLALEDGLIRAVTPADNDIGTRLLSSLPGSVAAPGVAAPKTTPHPVAKPPVPAPPLLATAAVAPIRKMPPPAVVAKPARVAGLADRKPAKHNMPARKPAAAPKAAAEAAPAPPAPRRPAPASVASIAPASSPDTATTQDAPAPRTRTVVMPVGFKMSYGPLKDVKLQDTNRMFMTARPSAAQPAKGRLLVDCVIETTGVPSNCQVLHAENAAGVQDAVLAMLVSGMVHKTPKTEDGHPVRARQTWTMEFPAQSQR